MAPEASPGHSPSLTPPEEVGEGRKSQRPLKRKGKVSNQGGMGPPKGRLSQSANIPGGQGIWGIQRHDTPVHALENST